MFESPGETCRVRKIPGAIFTIDKEIIMQTKQEQLNTGQSRELLTFTLGSEEYGIDILKVQEIRGYEVVTTIANTPEFIKGVINLRGIIVPIMDMRIKFNLGKAGYDESTVVIILNIANRVVGMVVDGVSDVITLKAEQIKPAPEFGAALDTRYLQGLGTVNGQMIILADIEELMSDRDMDLTEAEELAA
jgi:purine-binding chemotaxis protein CheW